MGLDDDPNTLDFEIELTFTIRKFMNYIQEDDRELINREYNIN